MKQPPADHMYLSDGGSVIGCRHCGTRIAPQLPMPIGAYVRLLRTFLDQHRRCPPPPRQEAPDAQHR